MILFDLCFLVMEWIEFDVGGHEGVQNERKKNDFFSFLIFFYWNKGNSEIIKNEIFSFENKNFSFFIQNLSSTTPSNMATVDLNKSELAAYNAQLNKIQYRDVTEYFDLLPVSSLIRLFHCRTANQILDDCFNECVKSFRSKNLDKTEKDCLQNCAQKYIAISQRVYERVNDIQNEIASQQ